MVEFPTSDKERMTIADIISTVAQCKHWIHDYSLSNHCLLVLDGRFEFLSTCNGLAATLLRLTINICKGETLKIAVKTCTIIPFVQCWIHDYSLSICCLLVSLDFISNALFDLLSLYYEQYVTYTISFHCNLSKFRKDFVIRWVCSQFVLVTHSGLGLCGRLQKSIIC